MPIEICVKHGGKIYCWDDEDGGIKVIRKETVQIADCPETVVADIMRQLDKKWKAARGNDA